MFRKRDIEAAPVVAVLPTGDCFETMQCVVPAVQEALDYTDAFEEEEGLPAILNDLVVTTDIWWAAIDGMPKTVDEMRQRGVKQDEEWRALADRSTRRDWEHSGRERSIAEDIIQGHNEARAELRVEGMGEFGRRLFEAQTNEEIDSVKGEIEKSLAVETDLNRARMADVFRPIFLGEHFSKATMATLELEDPVAFRDLFSLENIPELPVGLRQFATFDINHPRESIILKNLHRSLGTEQSPAEQLARYIRENHLPENLRSIVVGIGLGAKALGAPTCLLNDLGICTRVLAKIPIESLPPALLQDMKARSDRFVTDQNVKLMQFARLTPVNRMFDSSVAFNTANASRSSSKRRKSDSVPVEKRDLALMVAPETERKSFDRVVARVVNEDMTPVMFTREADDWNGADEGIQALLETKELRQYVEEHRGASLDGKMNHGLRMILFSDNYALTVGAIVPWANKKSQTFKNPDGVHEKFQRFSGQKSVNMSSGLVGRDTRILFSQATQDGVRYVTIHKIAHKSELIKGDPFLRKK